MTPPLDTDAASDLDAAQSRLAELTRLQRLYGPELEDVIGWAETQRPRLDELQGDSGRLEELEGELADVAIDRDGVMTSDATEAVTAFADRALEPIEAEITEGVDSEVLANFFH